MSMCRTVQTLCCAIVCLSTAAGRADSIDPETNTDGFNPAASAHQMGEARRLGLIARQLDLNYRMIRAAGCGPQYPNPFEPWPQVPGDIWGYPRSRPIEHAIGHESGQIAPTAGTIAPCMPRISSLPGRPLLGHRLLDRRALSSGRLAPPIPSLRIWRRPRDPKGKCPGAHASFRNPFSRFSHVAASRWHEGR